MGVIYGSERAGQGEPRRLFKAVFFTFLVILAILAIRNGWSQEAGGEQARLVIKSCPIATTMPVGDGRQWDTGISIVNVSPIGTNIVINRMEFFDARGGNFDIGFGYNVVVGPNQRWSRMLSEIIGKGRDGILQVHVITPAEGKWYLYESVFVDPTAFIVIEAKDVTSRAMQQP